MILPIVQLGHPVLRQKARALDAEELAGLAATVEAMRQTMIAAPGVGLAAPQVGLGIRLAVLEDHIEPNEEGNDPIERTPLPFTVFVNPTYEAVGDETRTFYEGCLSMDGYRALVTRHARVRASWQDLDGNHHEAEFFGWPARIVQHEIDHLDGIVYVDRCDTRSLSTTDNLDRE